MGLVNAVKKYGAQQILAFANRKVLSEFYPIIDEYITPQHANSLKQDISNAFLQIEKSQYPIKKQLQIKRNVLKGMPGLIAYLPLLDFKLGFVVWEEKGDVGYLKSKLTVDTRYRNHGWYSFVAAQVQIRKIL